MEQFSKFVASRLAQQQRPPEVHPAADLLTAFAEKRLGKVERKQLMAHLAICSECRKVVALTSGIGQPVEQDNGKASGFPWWRFQWAATLAVACLVAVLAWQSDLTPRANQPPVLPHNIRVEKLPNAASQAPERPRAYPVRQQIARPTPLPATIRARVAPRKPISPPSEQQTSPLETQDIGVTAQAFRQPEITPKVADQPALGVHATSFAARFMPRRQSLWRIDAETGKLRKSSDEGKSWQSVVVDDTTNFLALTVSGADVWAGGENGRLFRSTDDGANWTAVAVLNGDNKMSDAITAVELRGTQEVKVKTKLEQFTTTDGGVTWRKIW